MSFHFITLSLPFYAINANSPVPVSAVKAGGHPMWEAIGYDYDGLTIGLIPEAYHYVLFADSNRKSTWVYDRRCGQNVSRFPARFQEKYYRKFDPSDWKSVLDFIQSLPTTETYDAQYFEPVDYVWNVSAPAKDEFDILFRMYGKNRIEPDEWGNIIIPKPTTDEVNIMLDAGLSLYKDDIRPIRLPEHLLGEGGEQNA